LPEQPEIGKLQKQVPIYLLGVPWGKVLVRQPSYFSLARSYLYFTIV